MRNAKTISEHEGLILIDGHPATRAEAIDLLYRAEPAAECDATVLDGMVLAAERAGRRELAPPRANAAASPGEGQREMR